MKIESKVDDGTLRVWYEDSDDGWMAVYELRLDKDEPSDKDRLFAKQSLLRIIQRQYALQERPVG
jgi:hypothetical protein